MSGTTLNNIYTDHPTEDEKENDTPISPSRQLFLPGFLPDCDESDPEVDQFFDSWVAWFLCLTGISLNLKSLGHEETAFFSGLYVTRHIFPDNDNGWSIKEKEDDEVWLYVTDDGYFAEYMFPITATYNPDLPPPKIKKSSIEDETSTLSDHKFVWSKGVYKH